MEVPHKLQDLLLYAIIFFGGVSFIGAIGISAKPISAYTPYYKFPYYFETSSATKNAKMEAQLCLSVLILSIIFGVVLCVFWFLGRPTSNSGISWLFRIIIFICCFGESLILVITYSHYNYALDRKEPEEGDIDQAKYDEVSAEFDKWLNDNYPPEMQGDVVMRPSNVL